MFSSRASNVAAHLKPLSQNEMNCSLPSSVLS